MDIFAPSNYPHLLDCYGAWWDAPGGNSKADIEAMVRGSPDFKTSEFSVHLTRSAWRAAQLDPTFRALRKGMGMGLPVELSEIRDYWGVKEVSVQYVGRGATAVGAATHPEAPGWPRSREGRFLIINVAA